MENINGRYDMILDAFEVLENAHNIGTCIHSFKEYFTIDIRSGEWYYFCVVSTFMERDTSTTNE